MKLHMGRELSGLPVDFEDADGGVHGHEVALRVRYLAFELAYVGFDFIALASQGRQNLRLNHKLLHNQRAGKRAMYKSETFRLFERAIEEKKQIVCTYRGYPREICPHAVGWSDNGEQALAFQFAGGSSTGLPFGGEWRCFELRHLQGAVSEMALGTPEIVIKNLKPA
ncbi:hypothetical protein [Azorhizobium caulinodans]|uniref:hypothetical protein n=1 Tax=Azorhizobium caulinodans TaxID=7 RepID=UPI0011D15CAB|nr:hypothetical protein [Azorhizobium caulinodans]